MEIVTGKAGEPHVSSADDGRRIAGECGTGSYVLATGGKLAPSLVDSNTVRFATGDMILQGRHVGVTEPEDVKVASGTQGAKRMDYICAHYTRDVAGSSPSLVEKVEWKVLQGTPGTAAAAPTVPAGNILAGDADVCVPVASVSFDGLTTGAPKLLLPELHPLSDVWDSVSQGEPVVLFDEWSQPMSGSISLSEPINNFSRVEFCFRSNDGYAVPNVTVFEPAGEYTPIEVVACHVRHDGNVFLKMKAYKVTGRQVDTDRPDDTYSTGEWCLNTGSFTRGDFITVVRVMGWR